MRSNTKGKLFAATRVFMACVTFLLLTMTVMQRVDRDGYQATHLFFMPRENWEMDEGRGMLHEEEYYRDIDAQVLAEETYGWEGEAHRQNVRQDADQEAQVSSSYSQKVYSPGEHERWQGTYHSQSSALRRTPYLPNFSSNEIPVAGFYEVLLPGDDQLSNSGEPSFHFVAWQPDIPSPPPRTGFSS